MLSRGTGKYSASDDRIVGITVDPHLFQSKDISDKSREFIQAHVFLKSSDPADPFLGDLVFISDLEHLSVGQTKQISCSIRHTHHIKIGVHGIAGNIISDQFHHSFPDIIAVMDPLDPGEKKGMMCDQKVRPLQRGETDDRRGRVHCQANCFYVLVIPADLQP